MGNTTATKPIQMGNSTTNLANSMTELRVVQISKQDAYKKAIDESQTLYEKTNNRLKQIPAQLRLAVIPVGLYAFSKYKGYDGIKTAKVTIIGSVGIFALIVVDTLSGWSSPSNRYSQKILRSFGLISKPNYSFKSVAMPSPSMTKQPVEIQK